MDVDSPITGPIQLTDYTLDGLTELVESWGEKPFRAKQLWRWIHVKLATDIHEMTDLAKVFRARLDGVIAPLRPEIREHRVSSDGTEKWLLTLADGEAIEMVFIPEESRGTLCISSQVGCTLNCPFCHTGVQGFSRNLEVHEIVQQVLLARDQLSQRDKNITNLVLMGMGEPLYNETNVVTAVQIVMNRNGLAFGNRKVTLSTAGVLPAMARVGEALGVNLAISLHSVRDEVRDTLVPLNRKYNLAALRKAALAYPLRGKKRITWEYVMLKGVNDSLEDARLFARYLRGIPSKINLIPFNPWPGSHYEATPMDRVHAFQNVLHNAGYVTVVRDRRGSDIEAACGQLKGVVVGAKPRKQRPASS
ncbi:MAG: 23S rRNA (adenine(2503)-C(2))-methyltransferase RlmN [Magnetococcales bacterium]|nr:23S rRNA (adenine(2503)-C(2))-methyltransferase RlmN [Magnetococcales bacterium]